MTHVKYCLFDMDGLLLDTERVYTEVTTEIVSRFGKTFEWSLKAKMMGLKEHDAAVLLVSELQIPMTPQQYLAERNALHAARFPSCKPLPGVERLVHHLKQHNIPIAVATSSHLEAFKLKTMNNESLFSLFDVIVTGDDPSIKRGKPAPDIFLEAGKRLLQLDSFDSEDQQLTKSFLVFEDAPSGVRAALNANMHVCWVHDKMLTLDPELSKSASAVMDSMEKFEPHNFGLPAYV